MSGLRRLAVSQLFRFRPGDALARASSEADTIVETNRLCQNNASTRQTAADAERKESEEKSLAEKAAKLKNQGAEICAY
jgi:hypothetical protein